MAPRKVPPTHSPAGSGSGESDQPERASAPRPYCGVWLAQDKTERYNAEAEQRPSPPPSPRIPDDKKEIKVDGSTFALLRITATPFLPSCEVYSEVIYSVRYDVPLWPALLFWANSIGSDPDNLLFTPHPIGTGLEVDLWRYAIKPLQDLATDRNPLSMLNNATKGQHAPNVIFKWEPTILVDDDSHAYTIYVYPRAALTKSDGSPIYGPSICKWQLSLDNWPGRGRLAITHAASGGGGRGPSSESSSSSDSSSNSSGTGQGPQPKETTTVTSTTGEGDKLDEEDDQLAGGDETQAGDAGQPVV